MIKKSFNKLNLVKIRSDLIGNIQANYLYKLNILSFNYLSINFNLLKEISNDRYRTFYIFL